MASPSPSKDFKSQPFRQLISEKFRRIKYSVRNSSTKGETSNTSLLRTDSSSQSTSKGPSSFTTPRLSESTQSVPTHEAVEDTLCKIPSLSGLALERASEHSGPGAIGQPPPTRKLWDTASSALGLALRSLEVGTILVPPLRSVVGGILACLDVVQAATSSTKEYEELTSELTIIAGTLKEYLGELKTGDPGGNASCARIALCIEAEVAEIQKQGTRSKVKQVFDSANDQADVILRYRRIEKLFRQLQNDIGLQTLKLANRQHEITLLRGMSPVDDARYNSSYSTTVKRRGCTRQTRERVQADIQDWVRSPDGAKVYWMNGMAGTGKTTIAYSLCEWLNANKQLGASYFCSRVSPSCRDANSIVPALAYQLARYSAVFRAALVKVLEDDPEASKLDITHQFEKLLFNPLLAVKDVMPDGVVVVIDAMDECDDDLGIRLILGALLHLGPMLPLKCFVTSRPEPSIRESFLSPNAYSPIVLHLHNIEQSVVGQDIKLYLTEALDVMVPPPATNQIEQLAKLAGNLFIYAATVVRYIVPGKAAANSTDRLKAILSMGSASVPDEGASKKYKQLDDLYTSILSAALEDEELEEREIATMRLVLWSVVCAREPMSLSMLATFLSLNEQQVSAALQPLFSVVNVSQHHGLVSTLHASFHDYMFDRSRSSRFWCNQAQHNGVLAHGCFGIMKEQLKFNICGLRSSSIFDSDVVDLEQRVKANISPVLFYSCLHWGSHLYLSATLDSLCNQLVDFLTHRLLFWVEVLNFGHRLVDGISLLSHTEKWLLANRILPEIKQLAADARDFMTRFAAGACNRSTPHIYISALPFCPRSSLVYAHYQARTKGLIDIEGSVIRHRNNIAQATWMTEWSVVSLALSSDGTRIASGDIYGTIYVRDARTGVIVAGPFEGHKDWVVSVAFSPDGLCVVSSSSDQTIRVWDAYSGEVIAGPLVGHVGSVHSIDFSPDGAHVVSGSGDQTIRIWDVGTGNAVAGPFKGHTGSVKSVSYSPDGRYVASGSGDKTVRVWDVQTGKVVFGPFEGHTDWIGSVTFSPDGGLIASGSGDSTIRLWTIRARTVATSPLRGHTGWVNSIDFSPDGLRIVSGSDDRTIRIWDTLTGNAVYQPFEGHSGPVNSVLFSPDGEQVISASDDETIRVWGACTGVIVEPFEGHIDRINVVAFSPDGTQIVSCSDDQTVRVWDAQLGSPVAKPFRGHTDTIKSVAFSPGGTRIVSGSRDRTILVWDVCTSSVVAGPFVGHTSSVDSVAFAPNGVHIASGSGDGTVRVWDSHTGEVVLGPLEENEYRVTSVAFSPDGSRIFSAAPSHYSGVRVWDAQTGVITKQLFQGDTTYATLIVFSPDGKAVTFVTWQSSFQVWDSFTGDVIAGPFEGHTDIVRSVAFSPDGRRIVSASADQTIRVWDTYTADLVIGPLRGHTDLVESVAFSPNGIHVVSASRDQVIRVWDISKPKGFDAASDGWFKDGDGLLFWAPLDFHSYVPQPSNTLLIGLQGTVFIDYEGLLLGDRWSGCYVSP